MKLSKLTSMGTRARVFAGGLLATALVVAVGAQAAPALSGQALVDQYRACWTQFNQRSWAEFAKCYGPKSVSVAPGLPEARGGKAIIDKHARPFVEAFPDVAGELQLVLASGDRLMSVALMQGTHTGPLAGPGGSIPATGKKIGLLAAHGVEAAGTTAAAREWFIQDAGTMMGQLGLSGMPSRPLAKSAGPTQVVVATGSAQEKANLAAARNLYAAFNARDKGIADQFTDDVADRNQSIPKDVIGKQAVFAFISGFWQMSSNVKLVAPTIWAAGDYVVAIGTFTGVNDGALPAMGLPKTGKKFKVDVVEISRWRDGKLAELWPFYNGAQLAAQLGLVPPPPVTARQ